MSGATTKERAFSPVVDELARILPRIPLRPRGVRAPLPMGIVPPPPPPRPPAPTRPAQLQHAVEAKLMTFDELVQKVGSAPKKNRGPFKMSTRYKALQAEIAGSERLVGELEKAPASDLERSRAAIEKQLGDQLDAMIRSATAYRGAKTSGTGKEKAAQDLIDRATEYKANLKGNLDKIIADPKFADVSAHATVGELLQAKTRGLNFKDCKFAEHNDTKLDAGRSSDGFGAGAVNSVSKLVHEDGTERIFKPEPAKDAKMPVGPRFAGIDADAPHYGNRNVASKIAADLLGLNVMPEASFATHGGQVGLMMSKADGESPRKKVWEDYKGAEDPETMHPVNRKNYGLEKKGGVWKQGREKMVKPWAVAPSATVQAAMQEQLNGLEWTDMLTGQVDRHSANYFIDIQGDNVKVTGIDNDFCFGKEQKGLLKLKPEIGVTSVGQPQLIDKKTYDRLVALDFDRDTLPKLTGLLTAEEIAASKLRFKAVQDHAAELQGAGLVVDNWATWRSPGPPPNVTATEYLAAKDGPSLFKRDFAKFFKEDGLLP
jgi:hypothetical protein